VPRRLKKNAKSIPLGSSCALGSTGLESVLEFPVDLLQISHPTRTGGPSSQCLLAPVIFSHLGSWVSAGSASVLLDMKGATTTTSANSVCLVMALAKAGRSLRHLGLITWDDAPGRDC